jgi:hypothetical protein
LKPSMSATTYEFCLCTETNFEHPEWHSGGINEIMDFLRRSHAILREDNVLEKAVAHIRVGMEDFVRLYYSYPESARRIADVIGISLESNESVDEEDADE